MSLIFKNSFNQLPKQFYSKIEPEKTNKPKKDVAEDLEKEKIVLYNSLDKINGYWTLPLSKPKINNVIANIIINY